MASVMPSRPKTSSTGTSTSNSSQPVRRPSLTSARSTSGSASAQNGFSKLSVGQHKHNLSGNSNPYSEHSYQSLTSATHAIHPHLASPAPIPAHRQKRIKSQYPADSPEKHVEYILVASFDIDRGSIMEHQYPGPVGGDEHMLAELMLPDQAHVRSQDWTIFFLHKDASLEEDESSRKRKRRRRPGAGGQPQVFPGTQGVEQPEEQSEDEEEDYDEGVGSDDDELDIQPDSPPLVYVLNLVNTKQDNTVKRGAVVKAMAICTRHSFLHIYKPLLLLALEQYFASPTLDTLASLYEAVNSMDLSLMPRLNYLEKHILQASDAKDLFLEKFETMIAQRVEEIKDGASSMLEPPGQPHARSRFGLPRDTHEFESVVQYANVPVPVKIPTAVVAETVGDFSLIKLIQTFGGLNAAAPAPFNPTHPHLTTSGPLTSPIIVLLNALLTQKRVIFLGHNLPSSEVAEAVLAACALASGGLLRGFTRHAFPYTDLTKIDDLLKVPGFIAGVTNPAFAHKTEWWDLLCDLGTGKMRISNRIEAAPLTDGVVYFQQNGPHSAASNGTPGGISALVTAGASLSAGLGGNAVPTGNYSGDPTGDAAFMQSVIAAINERHGENAIRTKFRKWVLKFTRLAASFEETVYGASVLHIHNPDSPRAPFATAESGRGSHPGSPAFGSPSGRKIAGIDEQQLPPEVTGHGYVWTSPTSKHIELSASATRIEGWRNTRSYYNFIQDLAALYVHRPIKVLDVQHLHDRLAKVRLSQEHSANIYLALAAAVMDEAEVSMLITTIANGVWAENTSAASGSSKSSSGAGTGGGPGASGGMSGQPGLMYIAMGLFHQRPEVREEVADLLGRIRDHEAGRHFWANLGQFPKTAYDRIIAARMERLEEI